MDNNKIENNSKNGIPVCMEGLTFLALLILKLTSRPDIDWFWVFLPLWIIPVIVFLLAFVFGIILALKESNQKRKKAKLESDRMNEWNKKKKENEDRKKNEQV